MTSISAAGFPARPKSDHIAFLFFLGLVWVGVLSGFGYDSFIHIRDHGLDYPLIVHFHAVAFVGWLALFTAQVSLIRNGHPDLHRRLGVCGAALAGVMLVLGPTTAMVVQTRGYELRGTAPTFLAVQFTDMLAFAVLTGTGLLLRRHAQAHKRLMLLGLFYISDAAFVRLLNTLVAAPRGPAFFAQGFWGQIATLYFCSDVLMFGFGAYDFMVRRKLHPAYVAGVALTLTLQVTAYTLLHNPDWKTLSLRIIGH